MLIYKMRIKKITLEELQKIRSIADYQFGKNVGQKFFPETVTIFHSKNTGKIRHIYYGEELLATLRPTTGLFILTIYGAKRMIKVVHPLRLWVKVEDYAEFFIAKGRSVFAKDVISSDPGIRPNEEVIIISNKDEVLAVGRALLTGKEMLAFQRGIAVRVRRGITEKLRR